MNVAVRKTMTIRVAENPLRHRKRIPVRLSQPEYGLDGLYHVIDRCRAGSKTNAGGMFRKMMRDGLQPHELEALEASREAKEG